MAQQHFVIFKNADGQAEKHPMKRWLRENLTVIEDADDHQKTSHRLRRELKTLGWIRKDTPDSVLMIRPDDDNDVSYADSFLDAFEEDEELEDTIEEAVEITFGLERDLQIALRSHIEQLEPGLTIIDGGKERTTEAGRIDITAQDVQNQIVVIELKAGTATPDVVAQIMAYMGSLVSEAPNGIRGIIVAGDFHKRVVLAARAIPNLQLVRYSVRFEFALVK